MVQTVDLGSLRFVFRGEYDASSTYVRNDVVRAAGALYVIIADTPITGAAPSNTTPWALMLPAGVQVLTGTLAARPSSTTGNRLYVVTGDSTAGNNGLAFLDTGSAWVSFGGVASAVIPREDYTYNSDGTMATKVEMDAGGNTVKTTTFNYTSGTLTSITEVAGNRTLTTNFTYTDGNLTRVTRSVTVS